MTVVPVLYCPIRTAVHPAALEIDERFFAGYRAYHRALPWEASFRLSGQTPDLNTYAMLQSLGSGGGAFLALMEVYNNQEIPTAEYANPAMRTIRQLAALLLAWLNDLASLVKEQRDGVINLVTTIAAERLCGLDEAVHLW
jgi:Terpene synthase family 2, C-terminal metal binding